MKTSYSKDEVIAILNWVNGYVPTRVRDINETQYALSKLQFAIQHMKRKVERE